MHYYYYYHHLHHHRISHFSASAGKYSRLLVGDFGITRVDDITIGNKCAAFCCCRRRHHHHHHHPTTTTTTTRYVVTGGAPKQFTGAAAWKYPSLNRILCIKILHTTGRKSTVRTDPLPTKLASCPNNKKMLTTCGCIFWQSGILHSGSHSHLQTKQNKHEDDTWHFLWLLRSGARSSLPWVKQWIKSSTWPFYIIYIKQCGKNGKNFSCNTAGFFTMTMFPCTQYSLSIGFSQKNKTTVVPQPKFDPDPSPADFFPLSKMKSEFNKMPIGMS